MIENFFLLIIIYNSSFQPSNLVIPPSHRPAWERQANVKKERNRTKKKKKSVLVSPHPFSPIHSSYFTQKRATDWFPQHTFTLPFSSIACFLLAFIETKMWKRSIPSLKVIEHKSMNSIFRPFSFFLSWMMEGEVVRETSSRAKRHKSSDLLHWKKYKKKDRRRGVRKSKWKRKKEE